MTAEHLYLTLSAGEDDLDPDLEELLLETSWTEESAGTQADRVIDLIRMPVQATPHVQQ